MKYMLTLISEEGGMEDATPEEMKSQLGRWDSYTQELKDAGAFVAGEGLQESATATTVRIGDDDERLITDGPFAETKEQVGGFYLLECENLDQALEWAKRVPLRSGAIEIRPVMVFDPVGAGDSGAEASA